MQQSLHIDPNESPTYGLSENGPMCAVNDLGAAAGRPLPLNYNTQEAMTQTKAAPAGTWDEPKATALLVLADGTVHGRIQGFGATGHAVAKSASTRP